MRYFIYYDIVTEAYLIKSEMNLVVFTVPEYLRNGWGE